MLSQIDVSIMFSAHVRANFSSDSAAAKHYNVSRATIARIKNGQAKLNEAMLKDVKVEYKSVDVYKKIGGKNGK